MKIKFADIVYEKDCTEIKCRRIREEHNALVNSHAELLEAAEMYLSETSVTNRGRLRKAIRKAKEQ